MKTEVKKLELALEALEKEEKRCERRKLNKAEWTDKEEKRQYIKEYKRLCRLKRLPNPRVCPCCREAVPESRRWVVFPRARLSGRSDVEATRMRAKANGGTVAACRSCTMKFVWNWSKRKVEL